MSNPFFSASSVPDLSEHFADLDTSVAASPLLSGKSAERGVPASPSSISGCIVGPSFVWISSSEDICGGSIGSGERFCCKKKDECQVGSHKRKQYEDIKPGLYIKGKGDDAFTSPFVSSGILGSGAVSFLIKQSFDSSHIARSKVDLINNSERSLQYDGDIQGLFDSKPFAGAFTPSKRKMKQSDLKDKFDAVLETVAEESKEAGEVIDPTTNPYGIYLKELTETVEAGREDLASVSENVHEAMAQIGVPNASCPPSLWTGFMMNKLI